jgi:acetolactate synthase-1/2/3 large subunit
MKHTVAVADALAAAVARHGVTTMFGQSLPSAFFLAAEKIGLRQICYRTENAGGAMADGYARISRTATVVGAQNGPAATLLVAPLAEALKASIPVVAFVQDVPATARDRNAFQELDHIALFNGCSKWVRQLNDPARVDDYVDMAFTAATSGRPGPAVLLLPKDLLVEPAQAAPVGSARMARLGGFPLDRPRPSHDSIRQAAQLLATANRPLVVAGGGVHLSGAAALVAELQETAGVPIATTNMGKGAVDETHPLSVGVIGNAMGHYSRSGPLRDLVGSSDVIMLIGSRSNENGTDSWRLLPGDAIYIHIDLEPLEVGRNYESVRVVGDARAALSDLIDELEELDLTRRDQTRPSFEAAIAAGRAVHTERMTELITTDYDASRPEALMRELDAVLPPEAVVVADASYSTLWMSGYLTARRVGQRFLSPRGLAGLGWGLPMALGAKAAQPDNPVVCLAGDGGFAHVWAELETAVREQLAVTVILFNNSILGFQKHAELFAFDTYTAAIDFCPVDHAAIARAIGAEGVRVHDVAQFRPALVKALESRTVTVIEVMVAADAYPPITAWEGHEARLVGH